jgi:hypothetical protein
MEEVNFINVYRQFFLMKTSYSIFAKSLKLGIFCRPFNGF